MTKTGTKAAGAIIMLALVDAGCMGGARDDLPGHEGANQMGAENGVYGTLLHSIPLGDGHVVDFYDVGDSLGVVHEMLPVGGRPVLDGLGEGVWSLSELFGRVRPEEAIPATIVEADARAAQERTSLERMLAENPFARLPGRSLVPARSGVPSVGSDEPSIQEVQSAVTGCSGDLFGDAWGAQWFRDNYCDWWSGNYGCQAGHFTRTACDTNWGAATTSREGSGFQWKQMAGDFNKVGKTQGYFTGFPYPTPQYLWSHDIQPRQVSIHTITGGTSWQTRWASGTDECGHLHRAVVWCS